jgi:hypothetical protein
MTSSFPSLLWFPLAMDTMMSSSPLLLLSTYKTLSCHVLKPSLEDFDLYAVRRPKFPVPSLTPLSPRRCHPNRLQYHRDHAAAYPDRFQRRWVHAAWLSSPRLGTAPSSRSSPLPGPRCSAVTIALGNHAILTAVTATGSMPPGHHHHPVHASPTSSTYSSSANPLPLFPSPSVNSILLCLDVFLYDYA